MRKIRMGMVGGGAGAFIGAVHRMAAALDGHIELVCGAFSSDAATSRASGEMLGIAPDRVYANYEDMMRREKDLPPDLRMEFVSIVTPNHVHTAPALLALEQGFHVICDKPLSHNLAEARTLVAQVQRSQRLFALTHNYTGYPMVRQAKSMIAHGELGKVRKIVVEYPQGWLSTFLEKDQQKQAAWRTDPTKAGAAGSIGDIGTHAENLATYVSGLQISSLCADLTTFVEGRQLDDDGNILLRFEGGAKGILFASQIAAGEENNLKLRVWGEKGGIEWSQMEPNSLIVRWLDRPMQIYRAGTPFVYPAAAAASRLPSGHPEGYLEAFANIYKSFAAAVRAFNNGIPLAEIEQDYPTVQDGLRGMQFIDRVVASHRAGSVWVDCSSCA